MVQSTLEKVIRAARQPEQRKRRDKKQDTLQPERIVLTVNDKDVVLVLVKKKYHTQKAFTEMKLDKTTT